ncbi:MAG: hypothetical protein ABR58_05350 [Acidimicrobium sp. BACL19 MAG-120924-bin39]|nr:MAG: hypothetical protein ABR58_05350 [Acidimicrobium sp. BACL19 MAG-120924-bin39]
MRSAHPAGILTLVGSADSKPPGISPPSARRLLWHKQRRSTMKIFPGLTFSWKRAIGVTAAKRKISRATGVPLTSQGRRSKLGKWLGMK